MMLNVDNDVDNEDDVCLNKYVECFSYSYIFIIYIIIYFNPAPLDMEPLT